MYSGIDLGILEAKALVIDEDYEVIASHSTPLSIQRPHPHWSKQSPGLWWEATEYLMNTLREKYAQCWPATEAIGLSEQMHGAVLLDEEGETIRSAIPWNDTCCVAKCVELEVTAPELYQVVGNLTMSSFIVPRLLRVCRHEPQHLRRTATVLLPRDYLHYQMTGKKVSDMSDVTGTLRLDVVRRDWSDALLDKCDLSHSQVPTLVEGCEVSVTLGPQVAKRWGLSISAVVAGGGGDNAVSTIGAGMVSPGDTFISFDTPGVLFIVTGTYHLAPQSAVHAFCHMLPNLQYQVSVILGVASCLQRFCRLTGTTEMALLAEIVELNEEEEAHAPFFLPYPSSEHTPHNDPDARGIFWGIAHASLRAQPGYVVLEGVSFDIDDGLRVLKKSGTPTAQYSLVDDSARSPFWAQLLADIPVIPVVTHKGGETGGVLDAVRLACPAVGKPIVVVYEKPEVWQTWHTDFVRHYILIQRYTQFKNLYLNDLNY